MHPVRLTQRVHIRQRHIDKGECMEPEKCALSLALHFKMEDDE